MDKILAVRDVYTGNIAGFVLMFTLFLGNSKRFHNRKPENRSILLIMTSIALYCLIEPFAGRWTDCPGSGVHVRLYFLYSALFFVNMVLAIAWIQLILDHTGLRLRTIYRILMQVPLVLGTLLLILNVFRPLVFTLDNNSYARGPLYFIYLLIAASYMISGIGIYIVCRKKGGVLKYFPVWLYMVPILTGMILETVLGSSYVGVCNGIALAAVMGSLQDEAIFRDSLTGLYNRSYLEELRKKLERARNPYISGIMLDLNDFKSINDNYGHAEGDNALITAAGIIRDSVGTYGDVIRYAGDEFIVFLNTRNEENIRDCVTRIDQAFRAFNEESGRPYQLSASSGYANFYAETQTVSEFLNTIDRNMYDNKMKYYQQSGCDRRKQ